MRLGILVIWEFLEMVSSLESMILEIYDLLNILWIFIEIGVSRMKMKFEAWKFGNFPLRLKRNFWKANYWRHSSKILHFPPLTPLSPIRTVSLKVINQNLIFWGERIIGCYLKLNWWTSSPSGHPQQHLLPNLILFENLSSRDLWFLNVSPLTLLFFWHLFKEQDLLAEKNLYYMFYALMVNWCWMNFMGNIFM